MVLGGGSRCLSPQFHVFSLVRCRPRLSGQHKREAAPLRVPKINLVADYSPGGSLRDPPPRALRAPEPPGQGGRLPPPGDGGHLTDFVPN